MHVLAHLVGILAATARRVKLDQVRHSRSSVPCKGRSMCTSNSCARFKVKRAPRNLACTSKSGVHCKAWFTLPDYVRAYYLSSGVLKGKRRQNVRGATKSGVRFKVRNAEGQRCALQTQFTRGSQNRPKTASAVDQHTGASFWMRDKGWSAPKASFAERLRLHV